jgi:hypothetical protein
MRKCHRFLFLFIILGVMPAPGMAQTPSKPADPPLTAPSASISGRVTLDGKPVANRMVWIEISSFFFADYMKVTTDAEGRFTFRRLFGGTFNLFVGFEGFHQNRETVLGGAHSVRIADGETVKDIELRLRPGGIITGRITDKEDRPVVTQRLKLFRLTKNAGMNLEKWDDFSEGYFDFKSKEIWTDREGVYRISGLPPGRYIVGIGNFLLPGEGGYVNIRWNEPPPTFYPDVSDPRQATVIELGLGEVAANRDIRTGEPVKHFTIAGKLVDDVTGALVSDLQVLVGYKMKRGASGEVPADPNFHAKGEFRILGIRPGDYLVRVLNPRTDSEYFVEPFPITVRDGDLNLTIRLKRGATLTGQLQILGKPDSFLFSQCSIVLFPRSPSEGEFRNGILNADGTFQFVGVPPGNYEIHLKPPPTTRAPLKTIEMRQADEDKTATGITVGTEPVRDIRVTGAIQSGLAYGQLQFSGDQPLPDTRITVVLKAVGMPSKVVAFDEVDGNYRFLVKHLIPGTYSIKVAAQLPEGLNPTVTAVTPTTVTVTETGETLVNLTVVLANPKTPKPR